MGLMALFLSAALAGQAERGTPPGPAGRVGTLAHPAIREASGLVKSRQYPDVYWTHNDSGNPPALFAVRGDGSLIREYAVAVPNVDWEDIAVDDAGTLLLGDIGNNGEILPMRALYLIDEPDPSGPEPDGPLAVKKAVVYRFVRGERFDAESLVHDGDRALLISKRLDGREAAIYEVPLEEPATLLKPATPIRIGTLPGFAEPATGASLSPDGRRLAVCWLNGVRVYERAHRDDWVLAGSARFETGDQIEAITWDGTSLILAGEGRGMYRILRSAWRLRDPRRGK